MSRSLFEVSGPEGFVQLGLEAAHLATQLQPFVRNGVGEQRFENMRGS
jgi:hypothetical protein